MRARTRVRNFLVVAAVTWLVQAAPVSAQNAATPAPASAPAAAGSQEGAAPRDGQHDFDFMKGTWKAHLKRLSNPLTGSTTWVEFEGTQVTQNVWGGLATFDEFTVDSPATRTHIQGLTLRLYNPKSHQWSLYWSSAKDGTMGPPAVGQFHNGRGEFFDQEEYQGRQILVRYVWSDITANSARFEQSFSVDGGKTWEPNWISTLTREKS